MWEAPVTEGGEYWGVRLLTGRPAPVGPLLLLCLLQEDEVLSLNLRKIHQMWTLIRQNIKVRKVTNMFGIYLRKLFCHFLSKLFLSSVHVKILKLNLSDCNATSSRSITHYKPCERRVLLCWMWKGAAPKGSSSAPPPSSVHNGDQKEVNKDQMYFTSVMDASPFTLFI